MKKISVFIIFSIFIAAAFAQNAIKPDASVQSGRILAKAQDDFNVGKYTEAMSVCEEARIARRNEIGWACSVINNVLQAPEVKRNGPLITDLMPILKEREEYDAIQIINEQLSRKGSDFFNNNLPNLYKYLESLKDYPESDFLLAKIYRLEGEYDLAMQYLERARSHSDILDVPAQKYDILYEMADLAKVQGDDVVYEKTLLLVVENDGLYKNATMKNALKRAVTLNRKGVDLAEYFLQFFRVDAINSMTAYFELADLYEKRGEMKDSFTMTAFGIIVGFTHTVEILDDRLGAVAFEENDRRAIEYFFAECGNNEDVMVWTRNKGLWRGFFNLAMRARANGWKKFGDSFLEKLVAACPDSYWQKASEEVYKGNFVGEPMKTQSSVEESYSD